MDMDTNEITISRIVGYDWEEAGTDLEDEIPTPVSSPIVVPVIPPAGTADPYSRGDGFDLDLAKVMCDVSVIPSLITPLEDVEVPLCSMAAVCVCVCLSVCVCVCPANILVFYLSAIRRDIDLKFMQDINRVVLNALKKH